MLQCLSYGRLLPRALQGRLLDAPGPLTAPAYLALRRRAAGLSVAQAADRIAAVLRTRNYGDQRETATAMAALIRQLETPGTLARHVTTIDLLREAYPLDPNVYLQLAFDPADRHPRVCRTCGCSQWDKCHRGDEGDCNWAGHGMCTRCTEGDHL